MNKIKLFLVDDHQMLIDGIKALLNKEDNYIIIGEAVKAKLALEMIKNNIPDIVLTDISMPEMDGITFARILKQKYPSIKIIALSMFADGSAISEMLDAGALGYILKNTGKEELLTALQKVSKGEKYFSTDVATEMMKSISERGKKKAEEEKVHLTDREKEIIKLIAKEYSNAKIAEELFISERTVETHRKNINHKTHTKTPIGLMKYAIEHKLLD